MEYTLRSITDDIWCVEKSQKYFGLDVGTRMTIVRLAENKLMLISPVEISDDLQRDIEELGEVAYVVSPNLFHHLYIEACMSTYPQAKLFVARGLKEKRSAKHFPTLELPHEELTETTPEEWRSEISQKCFEGFRIMEPTGAKDVNEMVFFHLKSKTLIVTDMVFHFNHNSVLPLRVLTRLGGTYGKVAPVLPDRFATKARAKAKEALVKILEWPFERIILAHGDLVESEAKQHLESGYQWLLKA